MPPKLKISVIGLAFTFSTACVLIDTAHADTPVVPTEALAVLDKYCYKCHGPEKQKHDVRLDVLDPDMVDGIHAENWHDVLDMLNLGEMPPKKEVQPNDEERRALVAWITGELMRAKDAKTTTTGMALLRRMTRYEYDNTMKDLLGVEMNYGRNLPPESKSKDGFENNGMAMGMSPIQLEYYLKAARDGLAESIVEGDRPEIIEHINPKRQQPTLNRAARFKLDDDGLVHPGHAYYTALKTYPRSGVVRIKVVVDDVFAPKDQGYPQMLIGIGSNISAGGAIADFLRADVVPNKDGGPVEMVFTGRIENVQLPEPNAKSSKAINLVIANECKPSDEFLKLKQQRTQALKQKNKAKPKGKPEKQGKPNINLELPPVPSFVVKSVTFEGPIYDSWPPSYHHQILFEKPSTLSEDAYAKEVIRRFIDRAYRRPVTDADNAPLDDFYRSIRAGMPSFESAIRETLALALISPDFLYLIEPASEQGQATALTDHERATRLSYLLWSTMPDHELRTAADKGLLSNPSEMERQARRMLSDKRSEAFVHHFTSQWLDLPAVDRVAINPEYYPNFDEALKQDMKRETVAFLGELLRGDLSAMNLINSDFVVINRALALHYGLPSPKGGSFERVPIPGNKQRGGLLTQASMLLMNSNGEDSHPIRRAVWLRQRLLDDPPAPPPPDVPALESDDPDFASLPLKRQLELHSEKASCRDCHVQIDPWGIPMENYDAVGLWRDEITRHVNGKAIQSKVVSDAELPSGQKVAGINDLKAVLATDLQDKFARGLVRYMYAYSLGRSLDFTDSESVDSLVKAFRNSCYQLDELLVEIIKSKSFNTK